MDLKVRRATLEDLGPLTALWRSMTFDVDELTRRITEFQVIEDPSGRLVGAIGLQLLEHQGLLHSEGFTDFALAEYTRPVLWERLQKLFENHRLLRVWTREEAPFWSRCGLVRPDADAMAALPEPWRGAVGHWLTLRLRENLEELTSADKQFELFMHLERQKTQQTVRRAKIVKTVVTMITVILFLVIIGLSAYLLRNSPIFSGHAR